MLEQPDCTQSDLILAKWTILRYLVLGTIVGYRVWIKMWADIEEKEETHKKKRPQFSEIPLLFFFAGCLFLVHDGMGFMIYFTVSAAMDNVAIFFAHGAYCGYVKMVALYTMASITFLPNCWFAYRFQGEMWDTGTWEEKAKFVSMMVAITALSFVVRLILVYDLGWAAWVDRMLSPVYFDLKITFSVLVPPMVDALQSGLLIVSSYLGHLGQEYKQRTMPNSKEPLLNTEG